MKNTKDSPFLWGAATSSHQIEGDNKKNDWWKWEEEGNIEGGVRSGKATNHWNLFKEDLRLAADLGLNSYRFSIEWSRLEPQEGYWDSEAFEWYEALIAECERLKLLPMLTLRHFTSPLWFTEQGGFTSRRSPELFIKMTRQVARRLGSRVPLWCTLNEPMVLVAGGYLARFMPPARYSPILASQALANLLKCHVGAYDVLHQEITDRAGPWRHHPLQVGIAHNMLDFRADRPWHPAEQLLSKLFWRFYNRSWLDAVCGISPPFSVPGLIPKGPVVHEALGRKTADFIGVNYYTKAYVQWRPRDAAKEHPAELPFGLAFARKKEPASDVGWAIHPGGLERVLRMASGYGLPLYVTENGIADHEDSHRASYLCSHLKEIARLRTEKNFDVRGYYYWSLMDNFEWIKGYGPRFGLIRVNFDTFERVPQPSYQLLKDLISTH